MKETNRDIQSLCSLYLFFIRPISLSTYLPVQVDICRAWEASAPQHGVPPLSAWPPLLWVQTVPKVLKHGISE